MSVFGDLRILYHLALSPIRGESHADRLESFYRGQADGYDATRKGLLHGREDLWRSIPVPKGGAWLDMGGGTGSNLELLGDDIQQLNKVLVVDLSPSLLNIAKRRIADHQWTNVETMQADATLLSLPDDSMDVVTFSYSLTMIPDWFAALEVANRVLRPGGLIGVVDFFVSRKYPTAQRTRHGWLTRNFWPTWFGMDNVFLSPDHVPYLCRRFETQRLSESRGAIRYLPGVRVPYYVFIGRKPEKSER